ncbi:MAG: sigma-70 family RNA polymerase sigma factor [Archangiaceae bacterium]|nr:sigma-70 family RNA polymerase sigma factor [Archangiaceae bacterium]
MAAPDLRTLYDAELDALYGFIRRLGVPVSEVEDLVHDVFITALGRWSAYDPAQPLRPWLYGIAFKLAGARRRAGHTRELPVDALPDLPVDETATDRLHQRDISVLVHRALESLPEERRATVVMYELEGFTVAQISAVLEIPAPTVYSRLRVGREELQGAVRRLQQREGAR